MIFHAVFGDRDMAVRPRRIARSACRQPGAFARLSLSSAHGRASAYESSTARRQTPARLERLFDDAWLHRCMRPRYERSCRIGSIKCEDGAIESARFWSQRDIRAGRANLARSDFAPTTSRFRSISRSSEEIFSSAQELIDTCSASLPVVCVAAMEQSISSVSIARGSASWRCDHFQPRRRAPNGVAQSRQSISAVMTTTCRYFGRRFGVWASAPKPLRYCATIFSMSRRERRAISFMLLSRTKEDPIWKEIARDEASFAAAPHQWR